MVYFPHPTTTFVYWLSVWSTACHDATCTWRHVTWLANTIHASTSLTLGEELHVLKAKKMYERKIPMKTHMHMCTTSKFYTHRPAPFAHTAVLMPEGKRPAKLGCAGIAFHDALSELNNARCACMH